MSKRVIFPALASVGLILAAFAGCSTDDSSSTTNSGGDNSGTNDGTGSTAGGDMDASATNGDMTNSNVATLADGALDPNAPLPPNVVIGEAGEVYCGKDVLCECSNGIDDDGDGQIDGFDSECTGAIDDDEGSFATGIPGDNKDDWQDCFFDGNSGAGDDGCRYHTECMTGERDPDSKDCTVSDRCEEFCGPRTPNGCDCFGCCDVRLEDGEMTTVIIGTSCSIEEIDNPEVCPPCQKTDLCANDCGECELCPGKGITELPESCYDNPPPGEDAEAPPPYTCDNGATVCEVTSDCETGLYCSQGCCIVIIR